MKKLILLVAGIFTITAFAQWYDFIGQLQFDAGAPNPAQTEASMFYDNTLKCVAYYDDANKVNVCSGDKDGGNSLIGAIFEGVRTFTNLGLSVFQDDGTGWTTGNDAVFGNGAGGTAVVKTTTPAELLDGTSSWKITGASQNDWASIPYTPPAEVQNRAVRHTLTYKYLATVDGDWESRVTCDATAIVDTTNEPILFKDAGIANVEYVVPQNTAVCIIGVQCMNAAGCSDLVYAKMKTTDTIVNKVNLVEQSHVKVSGNPQSSYTLNTPIVFPSVEKAVGSLGSYNTTTGEFIVGHTGMLDVSIYINTNLIANSYINVYRNGIKAERFAIGFTTLGLLAGSTTLSVVTGEVITLRANRSWTVVGTEGFASFTATATSEKVSHATDTSNVDSMITFTGISGYGSSATSIPRYANYSCESSGTISTVGASQACGSIVCTDSASDSTECIVAEDGIYNITYADSFGGTASYIGITINTTQKSTPIQNVSDGSIKDIVYSAGAAFLSSSQWSGKLKKGDKIYPHNNGTPNSGVSRFTITKQASNAGYVVVPTEENEIQEKIISSNVQSDGVISDITFTGLEVGRKYKLSGQFDLQVNVATASNPTALVDHMNGATRIGRSIISTSGNVDNLSTLAVAYSFTATDNTLTFVGSSLSSTSRIRANGTREMSFIQLQKLPDESGLVTGKFAKVRTCYLKDKRDAGSGGGSASVGYNIRYLDSETIGDCGFLTKGVLTADPVMASNLRFQDWTLDAGKYDLRCDAPAFYLNNTHLALTEAPSTAPVTALIGTSVYAASSVMSGVTTLETQLDLNVATEYRINHYAARAQSTVGLGVDTTSGEYSVFTTCKITQILAR